MRKLTRFVRPILITALLGLAAWSAAASPLPSVSAQTQVVGSGPYRAGLVVRFDDGRVETRCVAFEEQEISGLDLLNKSEISGIATAPDGAVCSIDNVGCPPEDCFCQCPFPSCEYWAYYQRRDGGWIYSQDGQVYSIVRDGSLDGWSWGAGDFASGVEPPQWNFENVCPAQAVSTPSTATATATTQAATAPQVSFVAQAASVPSGQCTTLTWQTSGATSVTLDGVSVSLQGSQQVCPTASQTWTLLAVNAAGQTTTRQVTVGVQITGTDDPVLGANPTTAPASGAATFTPTRPSTTAVRTATPTPFGATPRAFVTQAPQSLPPATLPVPPAVPTADLSGGGVPFAPTAEPRPMSEAAQSAGPAPTATPFLLLPPATETPRPRRALNPDDPTPTPLLVARAAPGSAGGASTGARPSTSGGSASASSASAASSAKQSAQSRTFSPDLAPGYAAYVASVAVLLIMAWYVLRRRHAPVRARTPDGKGD